MAHAQQASASDPFGKPIPLDQFGPPEPLSKGDVFDEAAEQGDVFDQAANDPLVTGKGMEQRAQARASQAVRRPLTRAVAARDELHAPMPGSFEGHPENIGEYLPATIKPAVSGVRDIGRGNIARGAHELITSAGNASLPVAALTAGGASLPRLIGTVAGSTLGRTAARGIGEGLGLTPDQQDLAGDIGTIAGGYGGSRLADVDTAPMRNLAASKLRAPYTGNLKPWVPRIPFAKWATEAVVPRGEEGSITNPLVVPREQIETVAPGKYYRTTNVHIAQPPAEGLPAKLSTAPKSNLPGTIIAPEPRAPFPGEDEGYMSSIPRGRLPGLAASGKPGAATQLQNLGKTVLYTPPEGYPGPRVSQPLSPEEIDEALRPLYRNAAD